MLQTHYRSPLDFSLDRLDEARAAYERIVTLVRNIRWARGTTPVMDDDDTGDGDRVQLEAAVAAARDNFVAEMDDDFNTAGALGVLFDLVRAANTFMAARETDRTSAELKVLAEAEDVLVGSLGALGVEIAPSSQRGYPVEVIDLARQLAGYSGDDTSDAVDALLAARAVARTERNWAAADAVRDGLAGLGITVEDTAAGARVVFALER